MRALFSCVSAQHDFGEWMLSWGSQAELPTFCSVWALVLLWFPPAMLNFAGLCVKWAQPEVFPPSLWHCPCARTEWGMSMGWQHRNQGSICAAFVCTEGSHTVRSSQLDSSGWGPALWVVPVTHRSWNTLGNLAKAAQGLWLNGLNRAREWVLGLIDCLIQTHHF